MRMTRVRNTRDLDSLDPKREVTTDKLILRCFEKNKECDLGKIRIFLEDNKMHFGSHQPILRRLNSLILKGLVGRHRIPNSPYTYYLVKDSTGSPSMKGEEFALALRGLLNSDMPFSGSRRTDESFFLEKMVRRIGFFILYAHLQTWKFLDTSKSNVENYATALEWWKSSYRATEVGNYLGHVINMLTENLQSKEYDEPTFKNEKKIKKILDFEKSLQSLYPEEFNFCKRNMDELPNGVKRLREITQFEEEERKWIKYLERRPKKPKELLKPNECPRCHHDGIGPVKSGPHKGFQSDGFSLYYSDEEGKHRCCLVCSYDELISENK